MSLYTKILTKSLWVFHVSVSPCNNCDIEILDLITPGYDVERFGIKLVGSVRHADVLLCTGVVNHKVAPRLRQLYEQAAKPIFVVGIGTCTVGGAMFKKSYNREGAPLDKIIPVDAFIPGCPPKPEAMIDGLVKLIGTLT
jgi:membrane-bound hydrogenase subunit mbhJ